MTKWCVIQKTKTMIKSEFAVKMNTAHNHSTDDHYNQIQEGHPRLLSPNQYPM